MKILVLNCGSSSLKYQLFEETPVGLKPTSRGTIEKIGEPDSPVRNHERAIEQAFHELAQARAISTSSEVAAVGHRVVHGGDRFRESVPISPDVEREIEELSDLAPLHNPANLEGYRAARKYLPDAHHVAVFDTAFHSTLAPSSFLYGLPYRCYEEDRIRRYGFHGSSHRYLARRYAELSGAKDHKLVTCHLGNGCSLAAIVSGISVDTSMGFSPLEGLLMGTRTGDLDASILIYLQRKYGLGLEDLERLLNRESGLLGVSGVSSDMREVLEARAAGIARAARAIELYTYRIRKCIGAYAAALDGLDGVVFAGGVGENSAEIRALVCRGLGSFGVRLEEQANTEATGGREQRISESGSQPGVWVIPTNEELIIAEDTLASIPR